MADKLVQIDTIRFRRVLPWCHLFRAFRIAIDLRKCILGALALVALSAGNMLFLQLPFASNVKSSNPWETGLDRINADQGAAKPWELVALFRNDPLAALMEPARYWPLVLEPVRTVFEPGLVLFQRDNSWSTIAVAWTQLLWALLVWAVFGGAISRIAAVQFARDEKVPTLTALRFSAKRLLSYLSAPLLPLAGVGAFWLICFLGGLFARIPSVGPAVVGILWGIVLLFGFLMALIMMGLAAGWPLMTATISTEGSDAFDGLSRSFSYVYDRPWYYVWLILLTMAYGSVVIMFAWFAAWLIVYLAVWSVAAGVGADDIGSLLRSTPPLLISDSLESASQSDAPITIGRIAVGIWMRAVAMLLLGFVYSYFWTAVTIIYFLLRRSDDGTELDEVYVPEADEPDEQLPLVGVAASDQPVTERPMVGESDANSNSAGEEDSANQAESS